MKKTRQQEIILEIMSDFKDDIDFMRELNALTYMLVKQKGIDIHTGGPAKPHVNKWEK